MEYPRAYKWNIIEYPLKYAIIFHLGLPQEYSYSYSPRRLSTHIPMERGPHDPHTVFGVLFLLPINSVKSRLRCSTSRRYEKQQFHNDIYTYMH